MKHIAKNEGRISRPVVLQIKLEAVLKPGVLFFDCNATRRDAVQSSSPNVVRFDVVKAVNQFRITAELRRFYQAEVLVPSPVPANLIVFPDDVAVSASDKLKPKVLKTEKAESCKTRRSNVCSPSTSLSSSTTSSTAGIVSLVEGEAATFLVLQDDVISVLGVEGDKLPSLLFLLVFLLLPARCRVRASHVLPEVATSSPWSLLLSLPLLLRCRVRASYVMKNAMLLKLLVMLLILLLLPIVHCRVKTSQLFTEF